MTGDEERTGQDPTSDGAPEAEPVATATRSRRRAAAPVSELGKEEQAVVEYWLSYTSASDGDAIRDGGRLRARRGKLYYNPGEDDDRACIGYGRKGTHVVYTGDVKAPQDLQLAVAAYASAEAEESVKVEIDASLRTHL